MSGPGITDAISPASRANGSRAKRPSLGAWIHRNMGTLEAWDVWRTPRLRGPGSCRQETRGTLWLPSRRRVVQH